MKLTFKTIIAALAILLIAGVVFAQGGKDSGATLTSSGEPLQVWSFTDELQKPLDHFKEASGVEYEYTIVPHEQYMTKLRQVLAAGTNVPDVFTGEAQFVRELVDGGFWDNLSDAPYNADLSDMYKYAVDLARDEDGKARGLTWQTTPGAVFYRRSLAKKYLGTDDPNEVAKYFKDMDTFLNTARMVKEKSGGQVKIIPGIGELMWIPYAARKHAFIENGKFILDDVYLSYFDLVKTLRDEELTAEAGQWSPAWFDGMKKDSNIMSYFGCTWFLHYVLKPNAPDSKGDWGMTSPPSFYFWGGTWLGIYTKSNNKAPAWEFIKHFTLDPETMTWWAKETGDFISNKTVVMKIKDTFSDPYLAGQNHYEYFAKLADKVDGSLVTGKDQEILNFIGQAVGDYIDGNLTKEEAIKSIKDNVKNAYPDLIVE
ncbi:extracellular solute-binding protein [Spirochaetia bacterium 38H-sp]|uniref:Extracellular solute-binding protein n=1 Tax=Rarispira pelagica TaxID=3141764 RepID=A0ABU9UAT7_9SPIR